jgi:hypothetical protein
MKKEKQMKLAVPGWRAERIDEFLKLSPEESEYLELKLSLSYNLKERHQSLRPTQQELAIRIHSC